MDKYPVPVHPLRRKRPSGCSPRGGGHRGEGAVFALAGQNGTMGRPDRPYLSREDRQVGAVGYLISPQRAGSGIRHRGRQGRLCLGFRELCG